MVLEVLEEAAGAGGHDGEVQVHVHSQDVAESFAGLVSGRG